MKRITIIAAALVAAAASSAAAFAHGSASVVIQHEVKGCHAWSANGNPAGAAQTLKIAAGTVVTFTNDDLMPHRLVRVAGPALALGKAANLNHPGATFKLTFAKAGTYRLKTIAGEDYPGVKVKTIGEDNVLTLTVKVS